MNYWREGTTIFGISTYNFRKLGGFVKSESVIWLHNAIERQIGIDSRQLAKQVRKAIVNSLPRYNGYVTLPDESYFQIERDTERLVGYEIHFADTTMYPETF
jgi:hypothetical protein